MAKVNKVFVDQNDVVIAVHDAEHAVDESAYDFHGKTITVAYLGEDIVPSVTVPVLDEDGRIVTEMPRRLPAGWRDTYKAPVPANAPRRALMLALNDADRLEAFQAAIAGLATEKEKRAAAITVEDPTWLRDDPILTKLFAAAGMSPADVDDLFRPQL